MNSLANNRKVALYQIADSLIHHFGVCYGDRLVLYSSQNELPKCDFVYSDLVYLLESIVGCAGSVVHHAICSNDDIFGCMLRTVFDSRSHIQSAQEKRVACSDTIVEDVSTKTLLIGLGEKSKANINNNKSEISDYNITSIDTVTKKRNRKFISTEKQFKNDKYIYTKMQIKHLMILSLQLCKEK